MNTSVGTRYKVLLAPVLNTESKEISFSENTVYFSSEANIDSLDNSMTNFTLLFALSNLDLKVLNYKLIQQRDMNTNANLETAIEKSEKLMKTTTSSVNYFSVPMVLIIILIAVLLLTVIIFVSLIVFVAYKAKTTNTYWIN